MRGQAAISLKPDVDGEHVHIFESSKLESWYVGDLLYTLNQRPLIGDTCSIRGHGNPLQFSTQMAQRVKNLPAMHKTQETRVWSLG